MCRVESGTGPVDPRCERKPVLGGWFRFEAGAGLPESTEAYENLLCVALGPGVGVPV